VLKAIMDKTFALDHFVKRSTTTKTYLRLP
jgi:hypothetical protein